jgi:acyl-CoA hydrolase
MVVGIVLKENIIVTSRILRNRITEKCIGGIDLYAGIVVSGNVINKRDYFQDIEKQAIQSKDGGIMLTAKNVAQSEVHFSKLMSPSHTNPAGRVHAGDIMQMMYHAAYKVANRHAGMDVTAVRVDELVFLHPIKIGTVITIHAFLTFVGKSSMEVAVNLYVEGLSPTTAALTAYFVMVALDEHQQPTSVPSLELLTEQEKIRFEEGRQRYKLHHQTKVDA